MCLAIAIWYLGYFIHKLLQLCNTICWVSARGYKTSSTFAWKRNSLIFFILIGKMALGQNLGTFLLNKLFLNLTYYLKSINIFPNPNIPIFWELLSIPLQNILKVSKFQNEFMKSSFLPKYERNIVRISALHTSRQISLQFFVHILGETMTS